MDISTVKGEGKLSYSTQHKNILWINVHIYTRHVIGSDTSEWTPGFEYDSADYSHQSYSRAPGCTVMYDLNMLVSDSCKLYG